LATTAGTQYAISFGLRQDTDPTIGYVNSLSVQLGTITAYSAINIPAQEYATYTVYAQALSPASPLALTFRNDAGFFSLDDVSVSAGIPEPAMLPFLAFVLVAGFVLRSIYGSTKR
jgi:hypothetical protein